MFGNNSNLLKNSFLSETRGLIGYFVASNSLNNNKVFVHAQSPTTTDLRPKILLIVKDPSCVADIVF